MRPNQLNLWEDRLDAILPIAGSMAAFIIILMVILIV
jgi:hypothetical protein